MNKNESIPRAVIKAAPRQLPPVALMTPRMKVQIFLLVSFVVIFLPVSFDRTRENQLGKRCALDAPVAR